MLQIIKETKFPFMRHRMKAYAFSGLVILIGLASLVMQGGFKLGVDFTGGRLIEFRFNQDLSAEDLRGALAEIGYPGAEIQKVGDSGREYIVRLEAEAKEQAASEVGPSAKIVRGLAAKRAGLEAEIRKEELVGPRVGQELRTKAFWAVLFSLLGILAYVAIRYEFKFALGGVLALAHDVIITLLWTQIFHFEVTITIIAALMTIGGYSINDTVVVFDRVREEIKLRSGQPLGNVIDIAINKTLSRTVLTAFTTLLSATALFLFGGEVIKGFALAMMIGVGFGTFSSVYIASALALEITNSSHKKSQRAAA